MAKVKIRLPDGRTGTIPEENLAQSLAAGAIVVKEQEPEIAPEEPGMIESGLRGVAQGATLGFADELTGALEAAGKGISGDIGSLDELMEAYKKSREESRGAYAAAEEANPFTYGASNILGGFVIPAGAVGALGKTATMGQKALAGLKAGAAAGGVAGLGSSEADLTEGEVGQATKETLGGAALGGALGAGLSSIVPSVGKKTADWLKQFKGTQEFINALEKSRAGIEMFGSEAAAREGIATKETSKKIGQVFDEIRQYAGKVKGEALEGSREVPIVQKYNELISKLDEIVPASKDEEMLINKYKNLLDRLIGKDSMETISGKTVEVATRPRASAEEIQKTKERLSGILFGSKDLPYEAGQAGQQIKGELEDLIKSGLKPETSGKLDIGNKGYTKAIEAQAKIGGLPGKTGTSLDARMMYDKQVDNLVDSIQKTFANPSDTDAINLRQAFDIAKKNVEEINDNLLKNLTDTEEIAKLQSLKQEQLGKLTSLEKEVKDQGLNMITARHMMGESPFGGESLFKRLTGISGQAGTLQVARQIGAGVRAIETTIPQKLSKIGKAIYEQSPESLQSLAQTLAAKGSPFANKVSAALNQPLRKRNALLFSLMQTPGFREDAKEFIESLPGME